MSEIRETSANTFVSSAGQVQQLKAPSAVQESQRLGMYVDNVLGADGNAQNKGAAMDAVMTGCLSGYLGLGEMALSGMENPLASREILNIGSSSTASAPLPAVQAPQVAQEMKNFETLAALDSKEVNEVTLGLVPGVGVNMLAAEKNSSVALTEVLDKGPAGEAGMKDQHREALVNFETLAKWESDSSDRMAALENTQPSNVAINNEARPPMAANIPEGEPFDARPMLSQPVVEGKRAEYGAQWKEFHETLASVDNDKQVGLLGVSDLTGQPAGTQAIGLNTVKAPPPVGLNPSPMQGLMGQRSIVTNDLFGFLDLSSYTQALSHGINPTSTVALLKPAKYVSNYVNGYYT
jgi:hypothetical protein